MLDLRAIRAQFPITRQRLQVDGSSDPRPIVYLDNAATTHPPAPVLQAYLDFLASSYASVHRGHHHLSQLATSRYACIHEQIRCFLSAPGDEGVVILLGNTSQALDLAAHVMARVEVPPSSVGWSTTRTISLTGHGARSSASTCFETARSTRTTWGASSGNTTSSSWR